LLNESQVFETWAPILEEKTGIKDSNKLGWMSKYAHYHSLNEGFAYPQASLLNTPGMGNVAPAGTVAGGASNFYSANALGSGDKFPSLLPLAIQVAARTVGFDIVPVIPMNGPAGVLTYLDYVYAGGRDVNAPGIKNQNGLTGNNSFTDKFLIFKVSRAGLGATALADLATAAAGDGYVFTAAAAGSGVDGLLTAYVGKSRIDGGQIFRILGESTAVTATTAGAVTYSAIPANTQSITLADVLDGAAALYSAASVSPNALTNPSSYTTGTLTLVGAAGDITGSAELVRALEDHVQGFAGAGPLDNDAFAGDATNGLTPYEPMRRGVGETTQYRTMGLQAFTKFVEAETFQVAATVTTEQIQDLNRQYGIDVVSMMENALVNEISQSINKHILSRGFALGWQNHSDFYTVDGVNLNLSLVDQTSTGNARFIGKDNNLVTIPCPDVQVYGSSSATTFENQGTFQRRIQSKVLAAANVVAQRGRRGPGNFVVTNLQIATALQDSAQFTFYPLANTVNQNNGALYPLGTIAGMTIYVDPNMKYEDTRVLVGRKGADEEPGLKFMPYLMAESIQTIAEGTMAPKIAVKSRYALVEAGFHPQTQYFTFLVNLKDLNGNLWDQVTTSSTIA
jgi:hypothetical protein